MKKRVLIIPLALLAAFLNSCATFVNSSTQEIEIKSDPPNARILIDNKKFGVTPQVVNIDRGSDHVVKLELGGYMPFEMQITRKLSFWFWGNILNGFIPGGLIDMITGSMYNLFPESLEVRLQPEPPPVQKKK